jgi:lipid-binding SYLF domain-containing protein
MVRLMVPLLLAIAVSRPGLAQSPEDIAERLDKSAEILEELMNAPDVPEGLMEDAECIAVIPAVKRLAFGFGGQYGRGAASCRSAGGEGPWASPSMIALDGGSFGFQIGGSSSDLILLFMSPESMKHLLSDKVTLGADASIAAGPKGRTAGADTDLTLRAEILSYSRSRGLFAGVSVEGASLRPDNDANEALYGREIDARTILIDNAAGMPGSAAGFMAALNVTP